MIGKDDGEYNMFCHCRIAINNLDGLYRLQLLGILFITNLIEFNMWSRVTMCHLIIVKLLVLMCL